MSAAGEQGCRLADWDSAFFGLRIGRFEADRPSDADVERATAWSREKRLDCLYALVDADHPPAIRALERHAFELADVRLTLDRGTAVGETAADARIDEARPGDSEALASLARVSHLNTRFTREPRFDAGRAAEMYATWLANALVEPDALVLVSRRGAAVEGYLSLHDLGRPNARIGLLAVASECQRRGLGGALVHEALVRAARRGAARLSVVTQGGSASAVRFYERCGFEARRCQLWYHRWFAS